MTIVERINEISAWVDRRLTGKPEEAILWHRVAKVGEEAGEVVEALIGATDGNPRKPQSHTLDDVRKELLDTALAALCAWAHMAGNEGDPVAALDDHTARIHARAGLTPHGYSHVAASDGMVSPCCSCGWGWAGFTTREIARRVWEEHAGIAEECRKCDRYPVTEGHQKGCPNATV